MVGYIADAEYDAPTLLFILATNFLLYVALVLITYLVVKLYIESAPENPLFEESTTYERVPATHSGLELTSVTVQVGWVLVKGSRQGSGGGRRGRSAFDLQVTTRVFDAFEVYVETCTFIEACVTKTKSCRIQ